MTEPVTLRLDAATRERLDKLAEATERSRAALAADVVKQYIQQDEGQIAAIKKGVHQANQGQFIDRDAWRRLATAATVPT